MLTFLNRVLIGRFTPLFLLLAGGFLTLRIGTILIRHPRLCIKSLFQKKKGETSPLSSMLTALAGTLGVGNITGVASAIALGGAGALFWMWVSGFAVMILKYGEIVLACRYRKSREDGSFFGSAPQYIKDGLTAKPLSVFFALLLLISSISVGNMTQSGAAAQAAKTYFGIPRALFGIIFAAILLFILWGGGKAIMKATNALIPPLTLVYILLSLTVIAKNLDQLPTVFAQIFSDAFSPKAGFGGVFGFLLSDAIRIGTARGLFSNEAGCGTAPSAHAASSAEPARQGLFGILEVFVDTELLCTLTGIVVLLAQNTPSSVDGTEIAIEAFADTLGAWVAPLLALSIILYAFASAIAWAYYGMSALSFLGKGKAADVVYRLLYALCSIPGAIFPMTLIFEWTDLTICLMTVINTAVLLCLSGTIRKETLLYFEKNRLC